MVPRTVLTRSDLISLNTARPVNIVQPRTAVNSNTVKGTRVNTARPKAVLSAVKGNKENVVKASACYIRKKLMEDLLLLEVIPKERKLLGKGNPQQDLKDKGVIDSGCSRHMIGNRSYLTDQEEIDGGFVAFGDFKLTNESHVLLKVPRKDNMYSVDLKNVVPQGGLTCLFLKATPNESNLWHWRLGHVNFKTMNKLVKGNLVRGIENLIDLRVKVIRYDNETEFKNRVMNQLCEMKGIKRKFSVARTSQQNGVAEKKNRTLIEATRTMLADLKLPTTFWAEKLALSFMRPFGCPVTILNTIDHLGKFDVKADEGFFVGYSTSSKAFRVSNSRTRIVEKNMHVQFSKNTSNIVGSRPNWLFDIDALTKSMNYKLVVAGNQSNGSAGTKACDNAGKARVKTVPGKDYILLPLWTQDPPFSSSSKDSPDDRFKPLGEEEKKDAEDPWNASRNPTERKDSDVPSIEEPRINQEKDASVSSTNNINTISPTINVASIKDNAVDENIVYGCANDINIHDLEEIGRFSDVEDDGAETDMTNLDTHIPVSPIPTTIIHKDHPIEQIIRDIQLTPQTRRMTKSVTEHMDVKSAFIYGKIKEEVYVCQPPGFDDPDFPDRVYKVEKALYGLHQPSRACEAEGNGIFISQDKYVTEILKKFGISDVKTTSTPMETHKPLLKDAEGEDIDEYMYRSMIGSLMNLTSSRPDIMFVC
ncbi:putative ribonuclease H-like domain-containing protein [Tanacetum coccineum]